MRMPPQRLHHSMSEDHLAGQVHQGVAVGPVVEAPEGVGLVVGAEKERGWGG